MPKTFTNLVVHAIFSTKGRVPSIDAELRPRLFAYMGGVVREMQGTALIINGPNDHAHLLLGLSSMTSVAEAMRVVKANSSKWVHESCPNRGDFAWQTGYGAFSVSQSNIEQVRRYIANQEEHHRTISYQEEFIGFLKRHGITYDERFIWD